ncbi:MAG: aminotransferase class V-fold PLP-dependent enzyme [Gemmatimonadales bacterium]
MPATAPEPVVNPLASWRGEFAIFERTIYLNSCSLGALSRRARARVVGCLDRWDERGAANWYDLWWEALDELRLRYARLLHASPEEIALHASTSSILGVIGSGLDTSRRRRIVTTELDFPTVPYQWLPKAVEVVVLESPDGVSVPVEHFERAVNTDTALVATSHVYFTSGAIQDVRGIAEVAHRVGALCLIDGYQAAGQIDVDLPALDVDFYLTGGLKWLLGGSGITMLYARAGTTGQVIPRATGWFAHRDPFAFDPRHFTPRTDARRFETGTPALLSVHAQLGGLDVIEAAGVAAIRAATTGLTEDLIAAAANLGLQPRVAANASERTGIVMLPRTDPHADVARLADAGFIVDARPGHLRISPYFYNVADDHRALLEVLLDV